MTTLRYVRNPGTLFFFRVRCNYSRHFEILISNSDIYASTQQVTNSRDTVAWSFVECGRQHNSALYHYLN